MPAHSFDPYFYLAHKAKGGTFQNYKDKTYLALTDDQIEKHLKGDQLVGIYPLLTDNTSWFIAADFDGKKWDEECRAFINACKETGINLHAVPAGLYVVMIAHPARVIVRKIRVTK